MAETQSPMIESFGPSIPFGQAGGARGTSLEEMYRTHGATLYKIALRKLGNHADAEDALQEGLLSAFTHMNQFRGDSRFSTWLTSIVLNAARMQLRRRARQRCVPLDVRDDETGVTLPETLKDNGPNPEETLRTTQSREVLERCAAKLPPRIRLTFRLRVLEGLSTKEAAELVGLSEATIKARLFRAYRQITPYLRRALLSPDKRGENLGTKRMKEFARSCDAISPERSRNRRATGKPSLVIKPALTKTGISLEGNFTPDGHESTLLQVAV